MNKSNQIKKLCFFCSKEIKGKKSLEHIVPNALLKALNIKEETLSSSVSSTNYSRIKVPAHKSCNSEFGSLYEQKILTLLKEPEKIYQAIYKEETIIPISYNPNKSVPSIFTTWLLKIYYGLFYNDYIKTHDAIYKEICQDIIESYNFELVQKSYQKNHGFFLPSSLFIFKSKGNSFDLRTTIIPGTETILIKIKNLIFILCISDGHLIKNYVSRASLDKLKKSILEVEKKHKDYPIQCIALAEILAIRKNIPKSPKFISIDNQMLNMSTATLVKDPNNFYSINIKDVQRDGKLILEKLINAQSQSNLAS